MNSFLLTVCHLARGHAPQNRYNPLLYINQIASPNCVLHRCTSPTLLKTCFQFSPAPFQGKPLRATGTKSEGLNEKKECSRWDSNHGRLA